MPSALLITDRTLHNAPRVIRTLDMLLPDFDVYTLGLSAPLQAVKAHFHRNLIQESWLFRIKRRINRQFFGRYKSKTYTDTQKLNRLSKLIDSVNPDLVIVHDITDLPYLATLKSAYTYRLVFNAHEYYPLEFNARANWASTWQPYYEDVYARYLPVVDLMINVCESIRQKCLREFGKDSLVIPNAADFSELQPTNTGQTLRIIHHGATNPDRKIEEMIRLGALLSPRFTLDFMLQVNDQGYYNRLKAFADKYPQVRLLEPVPFREIIPTLNQYDIGLFILAPDNYNYEVALPNKLFEFIQAKLCLAIGPSVEMASVVKQFDLGCIAPDFKAESMAAVLNALDTETIMRYKRNSIKASVELAASKYALLYRQALDALA